MLGDEVLARLDALLADDDSQRGLLFPGARGGRQPVHTVYVPADRFTHSTVGDWGAQALTALDEFGPLPGVADDLLSAVRHKLHTEPIEDLRIDFEDGYGTHPNEDETARAAASALADTITGGQGTAFSGLRMKSLEGPTRARGIRTLDVFLAALLARTPLPAGFRVTLPKVTSVRQVEAMVELCIALESTYAIGTLRFEIQIETPQAILGPDGSALVARMLHVAGARCAGLHYGTYDYSASVGVAAAYQSMEHPAADYAKAVMQVAAAGTGVPLSDGSTNVLPVGSRDEVRVAWQLHARLVRRSLERGYYQGWDLHPAQLPTRFAATFAFYREGFSTACDRLTAYLGKAEAGVLDEPATALALAGYLLRGLDAGAMTEHDVQAASGLDRDELETLARRNPQRT